MSAARLILSRGHFAVATGLFALFIVYGSLVPLQYEPESFDVALQHYASAMTAPLSFASRSDWAANVLLFIPLGFVACGLRCVDRSWRATDVVLIPMFAIFSAAIEFLQLWFPARTTSINDVVAETLGGIIGMAVWWLVGQSLTLRVRAAWTSLEPGDWAAKLLPFYLLVLVFAHGMPFDLTISPGEIWQKYTRSFNAEAVASGAPIIAFAPARMAFPEKLLLCVVYFLPLGALLARLPNPRWRTDAALGWVAGAGLLVAAGIEGLQLIVLSCGCYASDVVCGTLCVIVGWRWATRQRTFPRWSGPAALGGWCVALAVVRWLPFAFSSERLGQVNYIPFADYYASNYLASFNRIFNVLVLFVPVGFFLPSLLRRPFIAASIGGVYASVVEVGQAFLTTHQASSSDVILGVIGSLCGAVLRTRLPVEDVRPQPIATPPPARPKIVFYTGLR